MTESRGIPWGLALAGATVLTTVGLAASAALWDLSSTLSNHGTEISHLRTDFNSSGNEQRRWENRIGVQLSVMQQDLNALRSGKSSKFGALQPHQDGDVSGEH